MIIVVSKATEIGFRVVGGIRQHFAERALEWITAINIGYYGWRLTDPTIQWQNTASWAGMLSYGLSEEGWGWVCVIISILRLSALAVNGTFHETIYSRVSPYVRGLTAALGAIVWFLVVLSQSAGHSSGGGIYQLPLVLDIWCTLYVFRHTGQGESARNVRIP